MALTKPEWDFPVLKATRQMQIAGKQPFEDLYSVKFYPYSPPGEDPIFAAVGGEHVIVARITSSGNPEIIKHFDFSLGEEDLYSCVWTKDLERGSPLLCVAGREGVIHVIDVAIGEISRVLTGHGGDIHELVISPTNLFILASASHDHTIMVWSLDPVHKKHPLAAILAGERHRDVIYTIAFHQNGRYLLSGGGDSIVNLWTLPEFPDKNTGTAKPTLIRYPHFSSSEIHDRIVDCIAFHGDLILSRAEYEDTIVLWSITNFSSSRPPPESPTSAPATQETETRSYFHTKEAEQFRILAQFHIPEGGGEILYMRFGLSFCLCPPINNTGPILAFFSTGVKPRLYLWDLKRLGEYEKYMAENSSDHPNATNRPYFLKTKQKPKGGGGAISRVRDTSPSGSASSRQSAESLEGPISNVDWEKTLLGWKEAYDVGDVTRELVAHREVKVGDARIAPFTGRMVGWSVGGEWCVVVGSAGSLAVFGRK